MTMTLKDIFEKISSYNILNYLIPGAIFWYLCPILCGVTLPVDNMVGELVGFYFVGMIIYSIGSMLIEPIYLKIHIVQFEAYSQYIAASNADPKLISLSESNNTFRTMIALCISLVITKLYFEYFPDLNSWWIIFILFLVFSFAYIKRTLYIKSRISIILDELKAKKSVDN